MTRVFCCLLLNLSLTVNATGVQELDKLMLQWSKLEQQYTEIDKQWRNKQPLLQQRLTLLQQEKKQLQQQLKSHSSGSGDVEQQRQELLQQQVRLESDQQQVSLLIDELGLLLQDVASRLPPHIHDHWYKELQLIKQQEHNSEKLEKQLALINQLQENDQRIALNVTNMSLAGGQEVRVSQFFVGISRGWYVSSDGKYWGAGSSELNGWQWQHQDPTLDSATLLNILAMLNSQQTPGLVSLPITLEQN